MISNSPPDHRPEAVGRAPDAARRLRAALLLFLLPAALGSMAAPVPAGTAPPRPPDETPAKPAMARKASDDVIDRLRRHVDTLAARDMQGRGPGGTAIEKAASYIAGEFGIAGLKPGGDDAGWMQVFTPEAASYPVESVSDKKWGEIHLANVIGILPGNAGGEEMAVVIGAHYDHLGLTPEKQPYPGADDNASGVAILCELASRLYEQGPYRNTLVFVAFSGEEEGTLGSRYYVAHPAVPLQKTMAMLNLDTVGRMEGKKLYIFGSASGAELPEILKGVNLGQGLDLVTPAAGPFASDQIPFFDKGIPVLHFFTGPNLDYHRPSDTPEQINYQGMLDVLHFLEETTLFLADRDTPLTFVPPGAENAPAPSQPSAKPRRASLGTIPDFSRDSGGVLLAGTSPGGPAERAGLQKGDILTRLGEMSVDNLADLSTALKEHEPGDSVEVEVLRGGEKLVRRVVLAKSSRP